MRGDFSRFTFDPKKRYSGVWMQQGRVQLDSDWNEQQAINRHRMEAECRDVVGTSGAPSIDPGFGITVDDNGDLYIGKGRYYVDGILCENDDENEGTASIKFQNQPDLPAAPNLLTLLSGADYGVVYLDAWHRDVTAVDDPEIKEKALGGADTTTRSKVIWRVLVLPVKLEAGQARPDCDSELFPKRKVALNAQLSESGSSDSLCILGPGGGYRGLENQLYRVEIHKAGPLGSATFKWARDNGSIEIPIIDKIAGGTVPVRNIGAGILDRFNDGTVVEIVDDRSDLNPYSDFNVSLSQPRPLAKVKGDPDAASSTILIEPQPDAASVSEMKNPKLRKWDSAEIKVEVPSTNDGWIPLGDEGVEIKFSTGGGQNDIFRTGDYWLIPARVASDKLEWPYEENENPIAQPPAGIEHHYARLAEIEIFKKEDGSFALKTTKDCRNVFPPLIDLLRPPAMHITGINWKNDNTLYLDDLIDQGLRISLDHQPDVQSVSSDTMIVTVETSSGLKIGNVTMPDISFILNGFIKVESTTVIWNVRLRQQLSELLDNRRSTRMRITLKGNAIWSKYNNQLLYLDGQAFGRPAQRGGQVDLEFPSGVGLKASDFESWCNLTLLEETVFDPNVLLWMRKMGFKTEKDMRSWASTYYVQFWDMMAKTYLDWFVPYKQVVEWKPPYARWFIGGKVNAAYNAVDRYKISAKDKAAYIFIPEPVDQATQRITYEQLFKEVNKLANGLKTLGVRKGDRVVIYMPMIPQLPMAMLACAKIGAIHSVVYSAYSATSLNSRILDAEPKVIITVDGLFRRGKPVPLKPNVDEATANTPSVQKVVVVKRASNEISLKAGRDVWYHELIASQSDECETEKMDPEDRLFIFYTGTTGKPKGIEHVHGGYSVAAAQTLHWIFDIKDSDVWWCTADIGLITGHSYAVYGPLCLGATSVLYEGSPDYPDFGRWFQIIQDNKVSVFFTSPSAIRMFMKAGEEWPAKYDLSSLRLLGSAGETISAEAWTWYKKNFNGNKCPIMDTWWLAETGIPVISSLPITPLKPGSPTFAMPGFNADILDADGKPVMPDQVGNLVLTEPWPSMFRGIYKDPDSYKKDRWSTYWDTKPGIFLATENAKRDKEGYIWIVPKIIPL